jgi:phosphomevalonate kinase
LANLRPDDQINKTGLGSSAALATSLTAALLAQLGVAPLPAPGQAWTEEALQVVHNTAQFAHCLAQGKIGSGFDVSAAVYGSQQYCRFSPSLIEAPLKSTDIDYRSLLGTVTGSWDSEHLPFRLPPGLRLLTGDVSVGSSTPTMVSKLLEWTRTSSEGSFIADTNSGRNLGRIGWAQPSCGGPFRRA